MKKTVLLIFGGESSEHEVSVRSARCIEENIDRNLFDVVCAGISQTGSWIFGRHIDEIADETVEDNKGAFFPEVTKPATLTIDLDGKQEPLHFDVAFPIVHGTTGEDGKLQGLLDMLHIPYVGSSARGSAAAFDKVEQKIICDSVDIRQTQYMWFEHQEWKEDSASVLKRIEKLSYPLFVKPANQGSSVGISKVDTPARLNEAVKIALKHDEKVVVEESIEDNLEIEVGIIGLTKPKASVCGSIKPREGFYDYETKYITDDIASEIPADIPEEVSKEIRNIAIKTYRVLDQSGFARVDFLYQPSTGAFYLNEINSLPGFTEISMFPKLWEASGLTIQKLITRLIEDALSK